MGTLRDMASESAKRELIVRDACKALDEEVDSKGGLGGMAIKTAYKMAKGIAPDVVPRIVNTLLDEFLDALQPFYDDAKSSGKDVAAHLGAHKAQVAEALLAITDSRANREHGGALKKGYAKLRPSAAKHVEAGVPRLATMLMRHAS